MMSDRRPALKPCPFCTRQPHRGPTKVAHCQLHGEPFQDFAIWCPHGHARIVASSETAAVEEWNARPQPDKQTDELDPPWSYAYRYPDDVLRMSGGREINGSKPIESIGLYLATDVKRMMADRAALIRSVWRDIQKEQAPRDRPVGLLSIQPQDAGGQIVTFDVCQWDDGIFELGFGFKSNVGHACATHWCEVEDLRLPVVDDDIALSSDGGVEGHATPRTTSATPTRYPEMEGEEHMGATARRTEAQDASTKTGSAGVEPGPSDLYLRRDEVRQVLIEQPDENLEITEGVLADIDALPILTRADISGPSESFQSRVRPWMLACFGPVIPFDKTERNHRFLEEALELVQSNGCTQSEAHQLVEYVFGRDQGDINQEVGGVMVTLAALCLANGVDMHTAGETELARIWTKVEQIRAKQASKPKHSPLPIAMDDRQADYVRHGLREEDLP